MGDESRRRLRGGLRSRVVLWREHAKLQRLHVLEEGDKLLCDWVDGVHLAVRVAGRGGLALVVGTEERVRHIRARRGALDGLQRLRVLLEGGVNVLDLELERPFLANQLVELLDFGDLPRGAKTRWQLAQMQRREPQNICATAIVACRCPPLKKGSGMNASGVSSVSSARAMESARAASPKRAAQPSPAKQPPRTHPSSPAVSKAKGGKRPPMAAPGAPPAGGGGAAASPSVQVAAVA